MEDFFIGKQRSFTAKVSTVSIPTLSAASFIFPSSFRRKTQGQNTKSQSQRWATRDVEGNRERWNWQISRLPDPATEIVTLDFTRDNVEETTNVEEQRFENILKELS